jgi:ribosomal protein L22
MSTDTPEEPEEVVVDVEASSAADVPGSTDDETVTESEATRGTSSEDDDSTSTVSEDETPVAEATASDEASAEDVATTPDDEADVAPVAEEEPSPAAPKKPARRRTPGKPAAPAPRRRRGQRESDPDVPAPVVRAQAKYVRSSARKARLVCDHIRGKSVEEARAILAVTPRAIARDWSKLLESAVANAEHNHELVGEDLYVKAVHADEGPTIKRFRPRAMGRATRIRKRTSHLTILLTPKD